MDELKRQIETLRHLLYELIAKMRIFGFSDIQNALDAKADQAALDAHLNDTTAAHAGTAISNTPAGNISAITTQAAINELDTEKASATDLSNHLTDTTDAHDASAISVVDAGNYFTGADVEAALQELGAAPGGTPGGSDGEIQYNNGGAAFGGDSQFVWDDTNKILLIGGTPPVAVASGETHRIGPNDVSPGFFQWAFSGTPTVAAYFTGMRARGTLASPTAVQNGDVAMRGARGRAYDGTGWSNTQAELRLVITENWDSTHHGMRPLLWGTAKTETTMQDVTGVKQRVLAGNLTLDDGECLVVGGYLTVGNYGITLNGDAGVAIL